ncbi:MAG TPA: hypothetical protein ENI33_03730 [Thermoplasmatales archaeon]|nr:hypothetical protein [Thermoplasmatales archaeon]
MYKIPKEEEIRKAIYKAMKKHNSFPSLKKLRESIIEELHKMDRNYTISSKRARILTARSGFVKVNVKNTEGDKKFSKCPVCEGKLKEIKNLSLTGKEIIIGYRCTLCDYKGNVNEFPVRYSFHFTK